MGTTNYTQVFIQVAEDCPAEVGEIPARGNSEPTIASLQHELLANRPYVLTSDDLLFEVHAARKGVPETDHAEERQAFFSKSQACLRASPLGKRYGWGLHHDEQSRVALVPLGSDRYQELANDPGIKQLKAMRSKRAPK